MKVNLVSIFILLSTSSNCQIKLAGVFSDNMVLQRDKPVRIWGKADPGTIITVFFANNTVRANTKPDSTWSVTLPPVAENSEPQKIIVSTGNQKIILHNILLGDVWLCLGQSNMEWPMQREMHFATEIQNSHKPMLRFYNPSYAGKNIFATKFSDSVIQRLNVENFYMGNWQQCDSNSIKTMSAVAYYFGKSITTETNVPVGLINLSIGGAPLETFIDQEALNQSNQFSTKVEGDWLQNNALPVWVRDRGQQNVGSKENVPADLNGKGHAYKPGFAYKAGIVPILLMPIKGILNYQGESNAQEAERVNEYPALTALMVNDYRRKWKNPKLPYYYVQLSSIDTAKYKGHFWPEFRNEQRKMLQSIPHSGMAVCSDIGARDDVHPTNKKVVGERLARWALNKTYKLDIVPSGPLPIQAKYKKDKVLISFRYAAKGLMTSDNQQVRGFSIDGTNELEVSIHRDKIIITANEKPDFIHYGWKPFSDANIINSENLPASTFKIKVR